MVESGVSFKFPLERMSHLTDWVGISVNVLQKKIGVRNLATRLSFLQHFR